MVSAENWLSLDLSTPRGSLALHRKEGALRQLASVDLEGPHRQSELLLPAIDQLLRSHAMSTASIQRVVLCSGPGSFTGLRIGFAFAKGFAGALAIPVETIRGSEARARAYFRQQPGETVTVVTTLTPRSLLWERFQADSLTVVDGGTFLPDSFHLSADAVVTDARFHIDRAYEIQCSATLLAEGVFERDTLQESQTKETLIKLTPTYTGGERFEPGNG
ncbi:MAG: tRNA (adenosine(37)-N6)-threonylcarbamoyltransferase complex dimerization subunit type 1 TsaB [Bdellovibrionales bacterium]|nr:tRNA (adenosine(37)-N6)-threonylcarbamoyltransferase complex dimerization subunit type 1 TsaB [Bdellovibrionales bacterium]